MPIADTAARLRGDLNLKTPDAIQAASTLACQASALNSNDPVFKRLGSLEVLMLEDLLWLHRHSNGDPCLPGSSQKPTR